MDIKEGGHDLFVEKLSEFNISMKNVGQDTKFTSWDSNLAPLEYKPTVSLLC
jgi:hypothetical protein